MVSPVVPRPALDISPPPRSVSPILRWRRSLPRLQHPQMWGLGLGSLALGLLNGGLVISAGVGLVAYQQLLQLSPRQRKGLVQRIQQGLPLPTSYQQQALVLAGVTGVSTYTFTALWHSTHSLLMALLLTGQGALALFAVGALVRSSHSAERSDDLWAAAPVAQMEHNLGLLSHPDPLKRLVAARRLVRLIEQGAVDGDYSAGVSMRSHLSDCFQLRLSQESDAIVRSALEDGQNLLRPTRPLAPSSAQPFTAGSAFGATEVSNSPAETQFVAAQDVADASKNLVLSGVEAPLAQASLGQTSGIALDETPETSTPETFTSETSTTEVSTPTAPARASEPIPRGRRTVEYVEYLDI